MGSVANILVVDDEKFHDVIASLLSTLPVSLHFETSGARVPDRLSQHDFALVILTTKGSATDGLPTAARIRENPAWQRIPLIFLTDNDYDVAEELACYSLGASDYLRRTVAECILVAKVRMFVELHAGARCAPPVTPLATEPIHRSTASGIKALRLQHALVNSMKDYAIFTVDAQGFISSWNRGVFNILGYDENEFVGRSFASIFSEADVAKEIPGKQMALAVAQGTINENGWHIRKDGQRFWGTGTLSSLYDTKGTLVGFAKLIKDETAKRENAIRLEQSEQRLNYALEVAGMVVCEAHLKSGKLLQSSTAEKIFGGNFTSVEEFFSHIHPDDAKKLQGKISEAAKTGAHLHSEFRFRHLKTKEWIWLEEECEIKLRDQVEPLATGVIMDISLRKQYELRLKESHRGMKLIEEDLKRSNRELENFASVASHDLKEPLRTISIYLSLIENRYSQSLAPEGQNYLKVAAEGANRLKALIDKLLSASQFANVPEWGQVDMNQVVAATLENLSFLISEADTKIRVETLPSVVGDSTQLSQVWQNLISNAVKFRAPGRPLRIDVKCKRREDLWCFSVSDNGIGFSMENAKTIFEMYRRLHTNETYEGSGIGLAFCRQVVARHKGQIWCDSEAGEGTTFYFTLPATNQSVS